MQVTGNQIDFIYDDEPETPGGNRLLGSNACKLQWLHGTNCLLVATFSPKELTMHNCRIKLLDFRAKTGRVSSSDVEFPANNYYYRTGVGVRDILAMEETNSICVANEYEDLVFMDLRRAFGTVCWKERNVPRIYNERCYPRLAFHKGQLFSSFTDSISVFCGPDWVLTSKLPRSSRGSICDFSIGGDRLFALHSEESVFDIWETPSPLL